MSSNERAAERLRQFALWAIGNGRATSIGGFERYCGISPRYITNSTSSTRGGDITTSIIARVYDKFPMINLVWLCTGHGEMIGPPTPEPEYHDAYLNALKQIQALNRIIAIQRKRDMKP